MERAVFITTESGTDLIVSFAIESDEPDEVKSLILLRTPKYEFALDDAERGVSVSHDDFPDEENDLLEVLELGLSTVRIVTQHRKYLLDVQQVDGQEIRRAGEMLRKMNFDNRFVLKGA